MGFWRTFLFELPEYIEEKTREFRRSPREESSRLLTNLLNTRLQSHMLDWGFGDASDHPYLKTHELQQSKSELMKRLFKNPED